MKDPIGEKTLEIMHQAGNYNLWLLAKIKPFIDGDILEIGAGIGNFSRQFKSLGKLWAGDVNTGYMVRLKKLLKNHAGFVDIEKGKYFFGHKKFNTVICMNVLEHIKNDQRALTNMYNLLESGGKLILLVPAHPWAFGSMDERLGHYRRYTVKDLGQKTSESGFKIEHIHYLNWVGIFGWFFNARVIKKNIIPEGQLELFDKLLAPFLFLESFIKFPFGLSVLVVGERT